MRLMERTLKTVRVAKRGTVCDARGAERVVFDVEKAHGIRVTVQPPTNSLGEHRKGLSDEAYGVHKSQVLRLIAAQDAEADVGDGVLFEGDEEVLWVCVKIDKWFTHKELRLERR